MQDHVQTCTVEQIVDMLVPGIMEVSVGVMTLIPQERVQSYIVEQVFDVLVQEITEDIVDGVNTIYPGCVSGRWRNKLILPHLKFGSKSLSYQVPDLGQIGEML